MAACGQGIIFKQYYTAPSKASVQKTYHGRLRTRYDKIMKDTRNYDSEKSNPCVFLFKSFLRSFLRINKIEDFLESNTL